MHYCLCNIFVMIDRDISCCILKLPEYFSCSLLGFFRIYQRIGIQRAIHGAADQLGH